MECFQINQSKQSVSSLYFPVQTLQRDGKGIPCPTSGQTGLELDGILCKYKFSTPLYKSK